MFIYNIKLNKLFKTGLIIMCIIIIIIFLISCYKIFYKSNTFFTVSDNIHQKEIITITSNNYTNILKAVHENIDSYIGLKINFSGYVYRVNDFNENQFVLARDMIISSDYQAVVVGFLCEYENISNFADNTWVEITGTITKGFYNEEIPIIQIENITTTTIPTDEYVYPPDDTYIPTNNLL